MLTQTLRELEENELIQRKVYREVPPRVEYTLTDTGTKMIPFIKLLREWGDRQMAKANIPSLAAQESNEDKSSVTTDFQGHTPLFLAQLHNIVVYIYVLVSYLSYPSRY